MTAEEAAIDTAAAQERLKGILGTQPPAAANGTQEPGKESRQRATRSDAGKPRESFYVSIPGVRYDMNTSEGRLELKAMIAQSGATPAIDSIIDSLLNHIDRLRK